MKKIFYYILTAAAITAAATSCEKFLDSSSPSTFEASTVYSSYDLTESTIFSISQSFGETNSYRGRYLSWAGLNSDIEWYNTFKSTDEKYQIAGYTLKTNNNQLNLDNGPFAKMYEGIERANLCIEGIRQYGDPQNRPEMAYLLGEALTLRAFIYYDLVKVWGDIPARFTSITSETIYAAKDSRDVIFKQLLADLEEAIPYLPYPGETAATSRTDRVNKVFAEGLYARIALMACGKAQRPDDGMVGTGDLGTNRVSSDPEFSGEGKTTLYTKALAYLKDAIGSGTASLEDFEEYWKNQSNHNNLTAGPGHETLFVIPFSDGRGRWNYTFAVRTEGSSYGGGATVTRGGDAGPVPTMWFNYDKKDVRRDITCVNWRWNADDEQELVGIQKWYFGKYRFDWMLNHPYTGGNDDGIKPVVMRYADILLMAAELANEVETPSAAQEYLLPVRERAFKGNEEAAETYVAGLTSKDAMFNAIVDERAFEFCGEMTRKFDLIRWGLLKSKMDQAKADMKDLRDLKGKYAGVNGLNGDIYWQLDGSQVKVWGFNGETSKPTGAWEKKAEYFNKVVDSKGADTGLYDALIDGIYGANPEQFMFWPIFNTTMVNSQGMIKNDYGYDNL